MSVGAGGAGASSYRISFVLPSKHTVATLPRPKPPIAIRIEEPEIVASYRFRGNSPSEATVRRNVFCHCFCIASS